MTPAEARGILGLSEGAGLDDLQSAYKKRSQFMHPDRFSGRPEGEIKFATAEFQRLTKARDILREQMSGASDAKPGRTYPNPDQRQQEQRAAPATDINVAISRDQAFAGNVILVHTPAGNAVYIRLPKTFKLHQEIRFKGRGDVVLSPGVRNDLVVHFRLERSQGAPSFADRGEKTGYSEREPKVAQVTLRSRNGLITGGIVVAVLITILLSVVVLNGQDGVIEADVSPGDLEAGDCLQGWEDINSLADVVSCEAPHTAQLVATANLPALDNFPGEASLANRASEVCDGVEYVDAASEYPELKVAMSIPTEQTWSEGDRRIDCFVYAPDGQRISGSLLRD